MHASDNESVFDFNNYEITLPSHAETYETIVTRSKELSKAQELPGDYIDKDFAYTLDIPVRGNCLNLLTLKTGDCSRISLGYYNPAVPRIFSPGQYGEFITYPEYVASQDLPIILPRAHKIRESNITEFNNSQIPEITRVDYDHPKVRELHNLQNNFLRNSDVVTNVLHNHYEKLPFDAIPLNYIEMDDCTSINVYLSNQEKDLVLKFFGSYYWKNELKRRCSVKSLIVGRRDNNVKAMDFEPLGGLATFKDLKILAELAIEAKVVGVYEENFSTFSLGIHRKTSGNTQVVS
jgi:hypothetical protein